MKLYAEGPAEVFKYLCSERGIAYFEGGWWMHDADRLSFNGVPRPLRKNEETKQISIDDTVYSIHSEPKKRTSHDLEIDSPPVNEAAEKLYEQALAIVRAQGTASPSLLQRKLKIGYILSADLMTLLEQRGVISPKQDGKVRKVIG